MAMVTKQQALAIIDQMYCETNPIKPHEAEIIGDILQNKERHHLWRFKRHVFCGGCRRELTVLDMFLSGLKFHSPQFISDYLYKGMNTGGGRIVYKDGDALTIQVFKHGLPVSCIVCGVSHDEAGPISDCGIYFYQRPGGGTKLTISMSELVYKNLLKKIPQN